MNTNYKTKTTQKRRLQLLSAVCLSIFLFVTASFAQESPKLPENGKIAFASNVKGHYDIFTINTDGSGEVNITNSPDHDEISPSWSPDGKRLAYLFKLDQSAYVLAIMDEDGSNKTCLIEVSLPKSDGDTLSWSPEGKKIAFSSDGEIFSIEVDGGNLVNLTNDPAYDRQPSWSPDGEQIAFGRRKGSDHRIYTMNTDGSKLESTLLGLSGASAAKWSPDGNRFLYFDEFLGGCNCLISAKTDGTNNIILAANAQSADWSPDGKKVVFAGLDGSSSRLYVMPATGDGRQDQIGRRNARQPDWQPLP